MFRQERSLRKIQFTAQAVTSPCPLHERRSCHEEVAGAIQWESARTDAEIIEAREAATQAILQRGHEYRANGQADAWLAGADAIIRGVSRDVNGPLLEWGCKVAGVDNTSSVQTFHLGASVVGSCGPSGVRSPTDKYRHRKSAGPMPENGFRERNVKLLNSLRDDPHSQDLLDATVKDQKLGRMGPFVDPSTVDLDTNLIARRFAVVQGEKVRPCDDESANDFNQHFVPEEKLDWDGADHVVSSLEAFHASRMQSSEPNAVEREPSVIKADVDAAFRRVPLPAAQRRFAWVAFRHKGSVLMCQHYALAFGMIGSVFGWDAIGALLCILLRRLLFLPLLRWVDDFYAVVRQGKGRLVSQHALSCLSRVVRAFLGPSSLADHKLCEGPDTTIIGLVFMYIQGFVTVKISADKRIKWLAQIKDILKSKTLSLRQAQKLAGRLGFCAQHCFHRLGRAMVRIIISATFRKSRNGNYFSEDVAIACAWWAEVLEFERFERIPLAPSTRPSRVDVFSDAAGDPAHLAAVLVAQGVFSFAHRPAGRELLNKLVPRKDAQIAALEMLAALMGLHTFADALRCTTVVVWIVNTAAERVFFRGSGRCANHNRIAHLLWSRALEHNVALWFSRVESEDNLADEPTRGKFESLRQLQAQEIPAVLHF